MMFLRRILIAFASITPLQIALASTSIDPKPEKVLPYFKSLESNKKYTSPYVAEFNKGPFKLYFLAADHVPTAKLTNVLDHPTMKTVTTLFKQKQFDAVIVEGFQPWQDSIPDSLITHAESCKKNNYHGNCGEGFYTILMAQKKGLAIYSGEPTEREIAARVLERGFEYRDLVGFYILRQIPQWKRRGDLKKNSLEEMIKTYLPRYREKVGMNQDFSFHDFQSWYAEKMPDFKPLKDLTASDSGPHGGKDGNFAQHVSHLVGIIRDQTIVTKIASYLNKHKTVLIVYGSSHLVVQEPALEAMLNKPSYKKYH